VLGYYQLMGSAHAIMLGIPSVDVPKPKAPSSDDIVNKGNQGADWLSARSGTFWTIIVILVVAALIAGALKRPFIRGLLIGVILLGIALAVVNN
jgi:hypothetical protein